VYFEPQLLSSCGQRGWDLLGAGHNIPWEKPQEDSHAQAAPPRRSLMDWRIMSSMFLVMATIMRWISPACGELRSSMVAAGAPPSNWALPLFWQPGILMCWKHSSCRTPLGTGALTRRLMSPILFSTESQSLGAESLKQIGRVAAKALLRGDVSLSRLAGRGA